MAAERHLVFLKFIFFYGSDPFCITVPNFVMIGQTIAKILQFFFVIFKGDGWHRLGFLKIQNFNGHSIRGSQFMSSCQFH